MPLRCLHDGREIFAFNITDDAEWKSLRTLNANTKCLRMDCCSSPVVLKTSQLGTRYFAHTRRGECTTAPESEEHLLAKSVVVDGIRRTTWIASVEQQGKTPSGEGWIADVMAKRALGRAVAFEIQWSRQTEEETRARQARYEAAGIRGMWLFRQHDFPVDKKVPAFRLRFDEKRSLFHVLIPSPLYRSTGVRQREADETHYWSQSIELSRFVEGALKGHLHFAPALNRQLPLEVYAASTTCWKCHRRTKIITELVLASGRILPNCPDIEASIYSLDGLTLNGTEIVDMLLPARALKRYGIGEIKRRYSKTERQTYLSNGCVHCDALQGRFFDDELMYDGELVFTTDAVFYEAWAKRLGDYRREIHHWWFDDAFK